jgi:hypothetical protein
VRACSKGGDAISTWVCENRARIEYLIRMLRIGRKPSASVRRMIRELTGLVRETTLLMEIRTRMMDRARKIIQR